MEIFSFEIKAKCKNLARIKEILKSKNAQYKGKDYQTDTYFKISRGRLKLREGNIENILIYYDRKNISGPKKSKIILFKLETSSSLKLLLSLALGVLVVVEKEREIYCKKNVKFHLDYVKNLGNFVEVEVFGNEGISDSFKLIKQCMYYQSVLKIQEDDLITNSYSDLLLKK